MFTDSEEQENNIWACGKLPIHYANEDLIMREQKEGGGHVNL